MQEPDIRIEHRDQLEYLLAEAAEIEHGLMCCYLYAAFSLGRRAQARLPAAQAEAVGRWRRALIDVALDEMTHLASVTNLMNAIGASPHFLRPNFPVSPGPYPEGVVVALAPFGPATVDHFVFLERPEGVELPDGEGFERPRRYRRGGAKGRLVPTASDYETVGHLYRGIESGLGQLAEQLGEEVLFCGDPRVQIGAEVGLSALRKIVDLRSAVDALETIVSQGEGAPDCPDGSHYLRFRTMQRELAELRAADPTFDPARGVPRNPVMRRPPVPDGLVWIDAEPAATVLDVGNAVYSFALRALGVLCSPVAALAPGARGIATEAMALGMRTLAPLGELLCELPGSTTDPDVRAGLTFTMSRSLHPLPEPRGAYRVLEEEASKLAVALQEQGRAHDPALVAAGEQFGALAQRLRKMAREAAWSSSAPRVAPPTPVPPAPEPPPSGDIEEARSDGLLLRFETKRCIHARHCVLGLPRVFLANVQGPWLHPEAARVDQLTSVAHACPSGAITYRRLDGGPEEEAPEVNVLRVREAGPYAIHADVALGERRLTRAVLCRCGQSKNKPFCDNSHRDAGFAATGEPATRPSEPLARRGGVVEVRPQPDGPLQVSGPLEICSGTGRTVDRVESARLCRCGGSSTKPFCDGTHAKIGFRAP